MAITVTEQENGRSVSVVFDGTNDFDWSANLSEFKQELLLSKVQFFGSAATDVMVIRDGAASGAQIAKLYGSKDSEDFSPPLPCRPYVDNDDLTFDTAGNALLILTFADGIED